MHDTFFFLFEWAQTYITPGFRKDWSGNFLSGAARGASFSDWNSPREFGFSFRTGLLCDFLVGFDSLIRLLLFCRTLSSLTKVSCIFAWVEWWKYNLGACSYLFMNAENKVRVLNILAQLQFFWAGLENVLVWIHTANELFILRVQ